MRVMLFWIRLEKILHSIAVIFVLQGALKEKKEKEKKEGKDAGQKAKAHPKRPAAKKEKEEDEAGMMSVEDKIVLSQKNGN